MQLVDSANSTFTKPELNRLAAYRAAVTAGFYTDWDGSAESTDTELLAWLRAAGTQTYLFTAEERQRLERVRTEVADGTRGGDGPPLPALGRGATPEEQTR